MELNKKNCCHPLFKKYSLIATIFFFVTSLAFVYSLFEKPTYAELFGVNYDFSLTINAISIALVIPLILKTVCCAFKNKCEICVGKSLVYIYLLCTYACWIVFDKQTKNGQEEVLNMNIMVAFNYLTLALTTSLVVEKIVAGIKHLRK